MDRRRRRGTARALALGWALALGCALGLALLAGCGAPSEGDGDSAPITPTSSTDTITTTTTTTTTSGTSSTSTPVTEPAEDATDTPALPDIETFPTISLPGTVRPSFTVRPSPTVAPPITVPPTSGSAPTVPIEATSSSTTSTSTSTSTSGESGSEGDSGASAAEVGPVDLGNGRAKAEITYPTRLQVEERATILFVLRATDFRPDGDRYDQSDGSQVLERDETGRERREWPVYGAFGEVELTLWTGQEIQIVGGATPGQPFARFYRESEREALEARYADPDDFADPAAKLDGYAELHPLLRGGMPAEVFVELTDVLAPDRCRGSLPRDPDVEEVQIDVLCRWETNRAELQRAVDGSTDVDRAVDDYLAAVGQIQRRVAGHMATQVIELDPDGQARRARWQIRATCQGPSELRITADRLAVAFPRRSDFPDDEELAAIDPDDLRLWLDLDIVATEGARCLNDVDLDGILDDLDPARPVPAGRAVDLCPQDPLPGVAPREQTTDLDGDGRGDACDPDIDGDGLANGDDPQPLIPARSEGIAATLGRWIDAVPRPVAVGALAVALLAAVTRLLLPLRSAPRPEAATDQSAGGPAPMRLAATPPRPADPTEPRTGLVLSGGGMRAAAFSLGAVLYLLDSGRLETVANVASVSGGSFTNARMIGVLGEDDPVGRRAKLRRYRDLLATGGLPLERASAWFVLSGLALALVLAQLWSGWWQLLIVPALLGLWVGYSLVARAVIRRWLSELCGIGRKDPIADVDSPVTHWFTSSEAGRFPVHISDRSIIHLTDDDRGDDISRRTSIPSAELPLSEVVRASAAFPGLPPVVLSAEALGRAPHQSGMTRLLGGRWVLRDGGFSDNLGHIVRTLDDPATYHELTEGGTIGRWLVVDASADAKQVTRSPFGGLLAKLNLGLFPTVFQIGSRASSDTTASSQRELDARFGQGQHLLLVDLGATAESIAEPYGDRGDPTGPLDRWLADQGSRGADAAAVLNSLAVVSTVPTTLGSIGAENTNALIRHGYAVAMCHFLLQDAGAPWIDDLDRWRRLDPLSDEAAAELRFPTPAT